MLYTTYPMIVTAQVQPTFCMQTSLSMHEYPSNDCVKPGLQPPHNTPLRLLLHKASFVDTLDWNSGAKGGNS